MRLSTGVPVTVLGADDKALNKINMMVNTHGV